MFSSFDLEIDIMKKYLGIKLFGKVLYSQNIIPADTGRFKSEMHLCIDFHRFFHRFDLFQHFLTAFRTADGFLTVEGFQFVDDSLLMFDFSLLVVIFFEAGVAELLFLFRVSFVITHIHPDFATFNLDDFGYYTVQEIAVVGYDKNSSGIVDQISLKPCNGIQIQMVGRLVQEQDIRIGEQQFSQRYARLLTSGKGISLFTEILLCKTKTFENTDDLTFAGIAVTGLKFGLQTVVCIETAF